MGSAHSGDSMKGLEDGEIRPLNVNERPRRGFSSRPYAQLPTMQE
jgi:hypothetical protein